MGDINETNIENNGANSTSSNNTNNANIDYEKLYQRLDEIINDRNNRNFNSISKSLFSEQGLDEEQVKDAVNSYKNFKKEEEARKTKEFEDLTNNYANLQKQFNQERLNNAINLSLIKKGLTEEQIPFISKMVEVEGILNDKSEVNKEKLNENIENVFKAFPNLINKKEDKPLIKVGTSSDNSQYDESSDALLRKAFGLSNKK